MTQFKPLIITIKKTKQKKIDELLGTQINEEDMEEINKEFEEIVQEQTKLPDVPTHELEPGTKSPVKQKGFYSPLFCFLSILVVLIVFSL